MATKITFNLAASLVFFVTACLLGPTEPEPIEEPCFIADTVGRSAEFNRDLPCWLWIHECTVQQVCVLRPSYTRLPTDSLEQFLHPGPPEFEEFGLRAVPLHDPGIEKQPLDDDQPGKGQGIPSPGGGDGQGADRPIDK